MVQSLATEKKCRHFMDQKEEDQRDFEGKTKHAEQTSGQCGGGSAARW